MSLTTSLGWALSKSISVFTVQCFLKIHNLVFLCLQVPGLLHSLAHHQWAGCGQKYCTGQAETLLCRRLTNYFTDSLALISRTCPSALSSPSSDDSKKSIINALWQMVPEISIFMSTFPPPLATRGRHVRRGRHTAWPLDHQWGYIPWMCC